MTEPTGDNKWSEWANYVLLELKRLGCLTDKISLIEKDIAILQLKAGVWGALSGAIITLGSMLLFFLSRK